MMRGKKRLFQAVSVLRKFKNLRSGNRSLLKLISDYGTISKNAMLSYLVCSEVPGLESTTLNTKGMINGGKKRA